jgi:hypothetical protein
MRSEEDQREEEPMERMHISQRMRIFMGESAGHVEGLEMASAKSG